MTVIGRSRAEQIVEMSKDILQMQFPSLRVVPEASRTSADCIIHDVNAGGDPYVGAYFNNGYFAVVVDRSCQYRMNSGETWIARLLTMSRTVSTDDGFEEDEEFCHTPAELMARIADRLSNFRPYDEPYVIYLSHDCRQIFAMPETDWVADNESGNCPGNFLSRVAATSSQEAIDTFVGLHPRSEEFIRMCRTDLSLDHQPPSPH